MKKYIGSIVGYFLVAICLIGGLGLIANFSNGFSNWDVSTWFNSSSNSGSGSSSHQKDNDDNGSQGNGAEISDNDEEIIDEDNHLKYKRLITSNTEVDCAWYSNGIHASDYQGHAVDIPEGWIYASPVVVDGDENADFVCYESTSNFFAVKNELDNSSFYPWTRAEWDVSFSESYDSIIMAYYRYINYDYSSEYQPKLNFRITKDLFYDGISLKGVYISIPFNFNENTTIDFNNLPNNTFVEFGGQNYSVSEFNQLMSTNGYSSSIKDLIFEYADKCDIRVPSYTSYYFSDIFLCKAV